MASARTLSLIASLFMVGCAVVLPPSGGPDDRTPPRVEACSLPPRSTNIGERLTVELRFSEFVERSDVEQSILITPVAPYALDWSGRSLEIRIDSLRPSTTYQLSVGTGYRDLRGNRATEPFTLVFSTGSELDSCQLQGHVIASPNARLYVLVLPSDTMSHARYLFPVATDGSFVAEGLPCAQFTVAAFVDANGNRTPDAGEDCGVASSAVRAGPLPSDRIRIVISTPRQSPPLEVLSVRARSNRRLQLRFSQPLALARASWWQLVEQSTGRIMDLVAAIGTLSDELELITADTMRSGHQYRLTPRASIADTLGGILPDTTSLTVEGSDTGDTTVLALRSIVPQRDTTLNESLLPELRLRWTDAIAQLPAIDLIELDAGTEIPYELTWLDDATVRARARDSLRPARRYQWRVQLGSVRAWNHRPSADTGVLVRTIQTLDTRNGGSLAGTIEDSCCNCSRRFVIVRDRRATTVAVVPADSVGHFAIPYLPEGSYQLDAFCDENGNARHDAGSIIPLEYGERLARQTKTVTVKARWQTTGIILRLGQ